MKQSAFLVLTTLIATPTLATAATADCSECNHELTAPLYHGCSDDLVYLTYDDVKISCGQALSLETTKTTPKFYYPNAEADALYSLVMIDTTGIDPAVGTQPPYLPFPIIHYGAMNIPGDVLVDGMSLSPLHYDETGVLVKPFVSYQKPVPAEQLKKINSGTAEEAPDLNTRAFNYEFMLGKQRYERDDPNMDLYTNWEFIGFLKRNVDTTNIVSTYFTTGYCVKDIELYGVDCPVPMETLSGYGRIPEWVADKTASGTGIVSNGNVIDGVPSLGAAENDGTPGGGAQSDGSAQPADNSSSSGQVDDGTPGGGAQSDASAQPSTGNGDNSSSSGATSRKRAINAAIIPCVASLVYGFIVA